MNSEELSRIGAIGLIAAMVPLVLGLGLGWPALVWVPLALGLPAAVGVYANYQFRTRRQRREWYGSVGAPPFPPQGPETAFPPPPEPAAEEPEYEEYRESVRLPSDEPDYRLNFSCTVCWRATGSGAPEGSRRLAGNTVISRALAVTRVQPATEWEVTAHLVAAELGRILPDGSGRVEVWAKDVELTLSEEDQRRLDRLGELRKDAEVRERERDQERAERAYLGDDVLRSTGSATVWWLAQDSRDATKVKETVDMLGKLATLSAAAHGTEVPPGVRRLIADSVGEGAGGCGATDHQHLPTEHITFTAHPEVDGQQGLFHDGAFHPNGYSSGTHFTVSATASPWPSGGDPGAEGEGSDALGHVDALVRDLLPPSDESGRTVFFDRLAELVAAHGGEELSARIRRHYAVPELPREDASSPAAADEDGGGRAPAGEADLTGAGSEDTTRGWDQRERDEPDAAATGRAGVTADSDGPWRRNGGNPDDTGSPERPAPSAERRDGEGGPAPGGGANPLGSAGVTPATPPSTTAPGSEGPPAPDAGPSEAAPGSPSPHSTAPTVATATGATRVAAARDIGDREEAPASSGAVTSTPPGDIPATTPSTSGKSEGAGTDDGNTPGLAPPPPTGPAPAPPAPTGSGSRPSPADAPATPSTAHPEAGPGSASSTPTPSAPSSTSDPGGGFGPAASWTSTGGYAPPPPPSGGWSDAQHRENGFGARPWTGWDAVAPPTNGHDPLAPRPDEDGFDQRRPNPT